MFKIRSVNDRTDTYNLQTRTVPPDNEKFIK